ncbi:UNVERIFIED_CONTAM: putative 2-oxoglutarate-dependent dioxygenase ANS [Sesamum radiatum]|uniref:2-oxoglutarate-dependent dioxygenase ANS n=1 Tax=Sesamum radiatum TaxID=300843 RepID=A0AAW2WJJ5_SESRA
MAGVSAPPAEVLLAKRVQELVITGEDPSGPYVCRNDDEEEELDATTENSPIPVVNIGHFLSGKWSDDESVQELKNLHSALSTWGCFQAIGHGIPSCFLDEVRGVGREFFEQPMEEKNKYAKTVTEFQGYGADPVPEEGQSLDWSDRLFLELVPEDQRNYRFWPQNPSSFKRPDLVLGLKPHADGSGYTVILQDEPGLQVLNHGKWYTVPKSPEALLVLMGDQMEIMSNGVFRSPVHRVLSNGERDRISIAVFYTPEVGKEIGPEEGLISAEAPRVFKMVKDYADIHWGYYQRGMRSVHTVKI